MRYALSMYNTCTMRIHIYIKPVTNSLHIYTYDRSKQSLTTRSFCGTSRLKALWFGGTLEIATLLVANGGIWFLNRLWPL